jgi:hypothetical protein
MGQRAALPCPPGRPTGIHQEVFTMAIVAFALPILPGKSEKDRSYFQDIVEAHRSEYEASRKRAGITKEMTWLQHTPKGDLGIVYLEVENPRRMFQALATSQERFDVLFREYVMDVHGVDLTQQMPGPLSELTFANQLPS